MKERERRGDGLIVLQGDLQGRKQAGRCSCESHKLQDPATCACCCGNAS